jgi:hypothetical protein
MFVSDPKRSGDAAGVPVGQCRPTPPDENSSVHGFDALTVTAGFAIAVVLVLLVCRWRNGFGMRAFRMFRGNQHKVVILGGSHLD